MYLRSVATALILTMAGLPIPAKEAKIPVCSLFMLFASKEKGLNESVADAGRFEEEVRDFSQILDKIKPGSFVMLEINRKKYCGPKRIVNVKRNFSDNCVF